MAPLTGPLVSVIVPVYNGERFLTDCLASILAQDYRPIEVIVVDDGSEDRTAEIAQSFAGVQYLRQNNQGPGAARNSGIAVAKGGFVSFFDHDDVMMQHKLRIQVGYLLEHPAVALVLGHEEIVCEAGVDVPSWMTPQDPRGILEGAPEMSAVVRKEVVDDVGGFDPDLRIAEDTEWVARILAQGYKLHTCEEVVMRRRFHGGNLSYGNPGAGSMIFFIVRRRLAERRSLEAMRTRGGSS